MRPYSTIFDPLSAPGEGPALRVVADGLDRLCTVASARAIDQHAIETLAIPGIVLMRRAAAAAFDVLRRRWPDAAVISVLCGAGNNAGDGYVLAGIAVTRGLTVELLEAADPAGLGPDAARARNWCIAEGAEPRALDPAAPLAGDVVVDALLGIGVRGAPRPAIAAAIDTIARAARPVLALDVPSGLDADTGAAPGEVVRADATVTFIAGKRGLFTGLGPACSGVVELATLALPETLLGEARDGDVGLLRLGEGACVSRRRDPASHKGSHGHLLVVGGDVGYGGAVMLAGEAALRTGAGLVTVATAPEHVAPLLARRPEIMARGVRTHGELVALLARADAVVVGPGLGTEPWGEAMLDAVLSEAAARALPLVIDADALNQIAARGLVTAGIAQVRTPHPGEAARLLGVTTADIEADRFAAARALAQDGEVTAVLKGAGSLVAGDGQLACCPYGNAGLATGGSGDVLSGIIGALLAAGRSPMDAAQLGVCLHGAAGDAVAAQLGQAGLVAGDLPWALPRLVDFASR